VVASMSLGPLSISTTATNITGENDGSLVMPGNNAGAIFLI
jgi:hypothetical protein